MQEMGFLNGVPSDANTWLHLFLKWTVHYNSSKTVLLFMTPVGKWG